MIQRVLGVKDPIAPGRVLRLNSWVRKGKDYY